MKIQIEELGWWQVAKAQKIDHETFNASAWSIETFWSEFSQRNRYYLAVNDENKEVIGFGGIAFNGSDCDLQTMVIKKEHQGKGFGTKLLDELLLKVSKQKSQRVFLEVVSDNEKAINLYKSKNFQQVAKRANYYPNGKDALIMQLDLRSN